MKLQRVHFASPIPIAGTQRRESLFDAEDAWVIERDDTSGSVHISGNGVDFWTDGRVTWVTYEAEIAELNPGRDDLVVKPLPDGSAVVEYSGQPPTMSLGKRRRR